MWPYPFLLPESQVVAAGAPLPFFARWFCLFLSLVTSLLGRVALWWALHTESSNSGNEILGTTPAGCCWCFFLCSRCPFINKPSWFCLCCELLFWPWAKHFRSIRIQFLRIYNEVEPDDITPKDLYNGAILFHAKALNPEKWFACFPLLLLIYSCSLVLLLSSLCNLSSTSPTLHCQLSFIYSWNLLHCNYVRHRTTTSR